MKLGPTPPPTSLNQRPLPDIEVVEDNVFFEDSGLGDDDDLEIDDVKDGIDVEVTEERETNRSYSIAGFIEKLRNSNPIDGGEVGWLIDNRSEVTISQKRIILELVTGTKFVKSYVAYWLAQATDFLITSRNQKQWLEWAKKNPSHKFSEGLLNRSDIKELLPQKKKKPTETPFRDSINGEARSEKKEK